MRLFELLELKNPSGARLPPFFSGHSPTLLHLGSGAVQEGPAVVGPAWWRINREPGECHSRWGWVKIYDQPKLVRRKLRSWGYRYRYIPQLRWFQSRSHKPQDDS